VIASVAELQLDAVAWPVFDIAFSVMSYPFRYSNDDWIDLGALAAPHMLRVFFWKLIDLRVMNSAYACRDWQCAWYPFVNSESY
jgi:hypothetical protein